MRNNLVEKCLVFGIMVFLSGLTIGPVANAIKTENENVVDTTANYNFMPITLDDYTDISVQEAWGMLNDPSLPNGIQIPIDVRTDSEWHGERIDTPYPEDPRHYSLSVLQNENGLKKFISLYNGSDVILSCKSGGRSVSAAIILVNSDFNGTIYNMVGGITAWKGAGLPTKLGNEPPYQPDKPSGSSAGITEYLYQFSTSTTDPDDDTVKYGWDWDGDNIVDDWTDYYSSATPVTISHSWTVAGAYDVKVIAEDNVGDQSDFSSVLTVTIVVNTPPNAPGITGPAKGKAGEEYEYIFTTTDLEGDDISYYVEWGDDLVEEWTEYYKSDERFIVNHTWDEKGMYNIQVKAKDIHGTESDWATLEVNMPKNKQYVSIFFLRFLDQHPDIFPILRYLIEL